MSKEVFTQDVLVAARKAALTQYDSDMKSYHAILSGEADTWPIVKVAARAITAATAAEREACAEYGRAAVMKFRAKVGGRYYAGYHEDMREAVATAIRSRSKP